MTETHWSASVFACLLALTAICARQGDVAVQLETHRPQAYDPRQIEVQAVVLGPQNGLRYKWFSVDGDFDPQQSYEPKTQFTFAPNASRDRVWVEVWRDNEKIAERGVSVNVEARPVAAKETAPVPELMFTRI